MSYPWPVNIVAVTVGCMPVWLAGGWTPTGCVTPWPRAASRAADGRLVLAVDITCWLRLEAHTSPGRMLCHTYGRGKDQHMMVPGWPSLGDRRAGDRA